MPHGLEPGQWGFGRPNRPKNPKFKHDAHGSPPFLRDARRLAELGIQPALVGLQLRDDRSTRERGRAGNLVSSGSGRLDFFAAAGRSNGVQGPILHSVVRWRARRDRCALSRLGRPLHLPNQFRVRRRARLLPVGRRNDLHAVCTQPDQRRGTGLEYRWRESTGFHQSRRHTLDGGDSSSPATGNQDGAGVPASQSVDSGDCSFSHLAGRPFPFFIIEMDRHGFRDRGRSLCTPRHSHSSGNRRRIRSLVAARFSCRLVGKPNQTRKLAGRRRHSAGARVTDSSRHGLVLRLRRRPSSTRGEGGVG